MLTLMGAKTKRLLTSYETIKSSTDAKSIWNPQIKCNLSEKLQTLTAANPACLLTFQQVARGTILIINAQGHICHLS